MCGRGTHTGAAFTLLELLIASVLSIGLTLIAAQFWGYFSVSLTELNDRARLAQEMRFAVEGLTQDFGTTVGASVMAADEVLLCRDGGNVPNGSPDWAPPDTLVRYSLISGQLVRQDLSSGVSLAVADNVSVFAVQDVTASVLRMDITVLRGDISRQVSLLWSRP